MTHITVSVTYKDGSFNEYKIPLIELQDVVVGDDNSVPPSSFTIYNGDQKVSFKAVE